MPLEDVFKLCFAIFNGNGAGDIDNSDLNELYNNFQIKFKQTADSIQVDGDRMINLITKTKGNGLNTKFDNIQDVKNII